MPLTAGSHIGAYEIVGSLRAGGIGEVYRARDPRLDRQVGDMFAISPDGRTIYSGTSRLEADTWIVERK